MGASQRRKGAAGENELVGYLRGHNLKADKISGMYQPGPDVQAFNDRYIECRRRSRETGYESVNKIVEELEGDASIYWTRMDFNKSGIFVMYDDTLLDLLDEADNGELWPE